MTMIRCDLHKKLICPKYSLIDFFPLLFFLRKEVGIMKKKASEILNNVLGLVQMSNFSQDEPNLVS